MTRPRHHTSLSLGSLAAVASAHAPAAGLGAAMTGEMIANPRALALRHVP